MHPEVEREARGAGGSTLPLLLAICIEGFWSQGANINGGLWEGEDTHAGYKDEDALLEAERAQRNDPSRSTSGCTASS